MQTNEISVLKEQYNAKMQEFQDQLDNLRADGITKLDELKNRKQNLKKNKVVSVETKTEQLAKIEEEIIVAKSVINANKSKIKELVKESTAYSKLTYKPILNQVSMESAVYARNAKAKYYEQINAEKELYNSKVNELSSEYAGKLTDENIKLIYKNKVANLSNTHKNEIKEIKTNYRKEKQIAKDRKHASFLYQIDKISDIRDGSLSVSENISVKIENYFYSFKTSDFFLKNGLYIIIFIFMIGCIIVSPALLSLNATMSILSNFSTKVFFALGVAGLILFGGTDLSVGRMVTLGSMFTCMLLNPSSTTEFFGVSLSGLYGSIGFLPTALIALCLSILLCLTFSLIAGFFTAKFKIHPFITTLGTGLIIWGLVGYGTDNVKTGTVSSEASALVSSVFKGTLTDNFSGVPKTLFYAIIAIFLTWFAWNKTKFGKNMYAVGGNTEAAAVSGINVFRVTLGIFGMAAILYGVGAFLQGIVTGSSSSTLGQGWELEAIAACVIGGISFSGGIGKVSGAVIGCLLFEILKYYLRDITGGSSDISNIFIGIIIIVAVTFDSMKYLKKK